MYTNFLVTIYSVKYAQTVCLNCISAYIKYYAQMFVLQLVNGCVIYFIGVYCYVTFITLHTMVFASWSIVMQYIDDVCVCVYFFFVFEMIKVVFDIWTIFIVCMYVCLHINSYC